MSEQFEIINFEGTFAQTNPFQLVRQSHTANGRTDKWSKDDGGQPVVVSGNGDTQL